MLNMRTKAFKISSLVKTGFYVVFFAVLFFSLGATPSYAQIYSQTYPYGNIYTPAYTPIDYNNPSYVLTASATNVTGSGATLNGQVSGNNIYGAYNMSAGFQYGTSTNLEFSIMSNNSNYGNANFSSSVSGLYPNAIYYFRAFAQTPQGLMYGNINSFQTTFANNIYGYPANNTGYNYNNNAYSGTPAAITQPATSVSNGSAQLNSLVLNPSQDPNTTTWFDYGTDFNLGNATTIVSVGAIPSVRHVNSMTGLTSGTTYYFRAVEQNSYSKNNGAILSFTTGGIKPSVIIYTPPVINSTDTVSKTNTPVYNSAATIQPYTTATQPSLGANVFGSGSVLPVNIFGWLILIILVLILVLAIKRAFGALSPKKENITL
jgi:disulfide bond formation protein DsbB